MQRTIVLWVPDWPVIAAVRDEAAPAGNAHPIAIMAANRVVACSAAARAQGVHRGQVAVALVGERVLHDRRARLIDGDAAEHVLAGELARPLIRLRLRPHAVAVAPQPC